jgi:hypothetical protein
MTCDTAAEQLSVEVWGGVPGYRRRARACARGIRAYKPAPPCGVPVATIKRHVTGRGNAHKAAVIAAVQALGFIPADDNEADALALLHWAIARGIGGDR